MVLKKLGGILNDFDNPRGLMKLGQVGGQGIQKIGSNIKFNIGQGLSFFSPMEITAMKLAGQAYRDIDERADEVDGFRYLAVLSTEELAVYLDPESSHMFLSIRGTANLSDAVTDLRLIARNARSSPRFTRNTEEFVDIVNRVQPSTVSLTSHSLGSAIAIHLFDQFTNQIPFYFNYMFNPAVIIDEIITSGFNQELVNKSTVFRTTQDIVSLGSAFSNFDVKTMPLKKDDFISGHKLNIFEQILNEKDVKKKDNNNFTF